MAAVTGGARCTEPEAQRAGCECPSTWSTCGAAQRGAAVARPRFARGQRGARTSGAPASSPQAGAGAGLERPQPSGLLVQVQQVRGAAGGVVCCRLCFFVTSRRHRRSRRNQLVHARGNGNSNDHGCSSDNTCGSDENHAATRRRRHARSGRSAQQGARCASERLHAAGRRWSVQVRPARRLGCPRRSRASAAGRDATHSRYNCRAFAPVRAL